MLMIYSDYRSTQKQQCLQSDVFGASWLSSLKGIQQVGQSLKKLETTQILTNNSIINLSKI